MLSTSASWRDGVVASTRVASAKSCCCCLSTASEVRSMRKRIVSVAPSSTAGATTDGLRKRSLADARLPE